MERRELEVGKRYAMREKQAVGEPFVKVQVLDIPERGTQVRIRRLSEPHSGLEEWVKTRKFVVPWSDHQSFLKDEERSQRFDEARPKRNQALAGAIRTVLCSTGYHGAWADDDGTVCMEAFDLREIARRAGLPQNLEDMHPAAYVDRRGRMHLPTEVAERLAHAYASAEPESVLMYIEDEEKEYKARGNEPGERFWHDELREDMPGFALARFWAGHEEEVAYLRTEIERLRQLVESAADTLVASGAESEGWRLRRALQEG